MTTNSKTKLQMKNPLTVTFWTKDLADAIETDTCCLSCILHLHTTGNQKGNDTETTLTYLIEFDKNLKKIFVNIVLKYLQIIKLF